MKVSKSIQYLFIVGITAMLLMGCSEAYYSFEQPSELVEQQELMCLRAAEREEVLMSLTDEERIALAVYRTGTFKISEDAALGMLQQFIASTNSEQGVSTRSIGGANTHRVQNASLRRSARTGNPLYFEIAFENDCGNSGFSIISADQRMPYVLAFSEFGSLNDTTYNRSLAFALEMVRQYAEVQTARELDIDALVLSAQEKIQPSWWEWDRCGECGHCGGWQLCFYIGIEGLGCRPNVRCCRCDTCGTGILLYSYIMTDIHPQRLRSIPGGWHQGRPFNSLLPHVPGTTMRAWAGCDMIAVAQIMTFHRRPYRSARVAISTADWNTIAANNHIAGYNPLVQRLLYDMFRAMNTRFNVGGTYSNITQARNFLSNNGFSVGSAVNFSHSNVMNALLHGPVYIRGTDTSRSDKPGHAWVITGAQSVRTISVERYFIPNTGQTISHWEFTNINNYVRFDWGWGGNDSPVPPSINPWFRSGVFQASFFHPNFNRDVQIISHIR